MSALAKHYLQEGCLVTGYDQKECETTKELEKLGVLFTDGKDADKIVVTSAIHGEIKADCPVLSRAEAWKEIMTEYETSIGVAGCHGKTTTTAMLAHIFWVAGKRFTAHIGGNDRVFGNYVNFGKEYFITEACEYQKNFLSMQTEISLLLNVDIDHMDSYANEAELRSCFFSFCKNAKKCVVPFGYPIGVTFGIGEGEYQARHVVEKRGKYSFHLWGKGKKLCKISLSVVGKHNVWNALAAATVSLECGIAPEYIQKALNEFLPVRRRFEKIGMYRGAEVIADYAHHPEEIKATVFSAKQRTRGKVIVVFQPHTYSRTKYFKKEFSEVLQGAILYKTFPAREEYDEEGSAKSLADETKNSRYADSERELEILLKSRVKKKDCVLFLGAGDIYEIAKRIIS